MLDVPTMECHQPRQLHITITHGSNAKCRPWPDTMKIAVAHMLQCLSRNSSKKYSHVSYAPRNSIEHGIYETPLAMAPIRYHWSKLQQITVGWPPTKYHRLWLLCNNVVRSSKEKYDSEKKQAKIREQNNSNRYDYEYYKYQQWLSDYDVVQI